MRLLVLGGTGWLSRYAAEEAVRRGHQVTCLARGLRGPAPEGAELVRGDRDEPGGHLAVVGEFDATIDVTSQPGQLRRARSELGERLGHLVYVSTGSVYAPPFRPGDDEGAPLVPALAGDRLEDLADYGAAKVACEELARGGLIARAGLIGGPGDRTGRSGYWPWRFARDVHAPVLVPAALDQPFQVIDVRDLAAWLVTGAEQRLAGPMDAVGEPTTLGRFLDVARQVAGHDGDLVPAEAGWLAEHGVEPWMGPRSLPGWLGPDPDWWQFCAREGATARAAGLTRRPMAELLAGAMTTYDDLAEPPAGLSDADQADLLARIAS